MAYIPDNGNWDGFEFSNRQQYNRINDIYERLRDDDEYPNRAKLFQDAAMNAAYLEDKSTAQIFNGNSHFMRGFRAAEREGFSHAHDGKYARWLEYVGFRDPGDDGDMYTEVEE